MLEEKIIQLEIRIAHQDHLLEELNQVIYEQQKLLDKLYLNVANLNNQLKQSELNRNPKTIAEEKPPHY